MEAPDIPGAQQVVEWFGYWPSFHDAEVVSITLSRSGESSVLVHAFENSREVDARGYFVLTKHAMVTFHCEGWPLDGEGISNTHLDYFNAQNGLSVTLEPGIPADSIYAR